MSMLGSLGFGLTTSSVFESRGKHGFSWLSPSHMCYMIEPPRPAEFDSKLCDSVLDDLQMMSDMEESSMNVDGVSGSRSVEITELDAANGNIAVQISKLDLSGISDLEHENDQSPGEVAQNDESSLVKVEHLPELSSPRFIWFLCLMTPLLSLVIIPDSGRNFLIPTG
ncbi:unnamed protein product [Gongylonema pulchrum]|uniref:Uncharacterized protein n=1 Tax=Gongylonema pulchrum TaxID=637853 RepID=A0A183D336_9BILA|nr:unnamed protein product [Gongylonema pulchrum]